MRLPNETRQMVNLVKNPVWAAFAKKPVHTDTQTSIGLAARKSLYALQNGDGKLAHYTELHVTSHAAIVLAERGFGEDLLPAFQDSLRVVQACRRRVHQGNPWTLDPEEGQTIALLLDLHEQQVQLAEKGELAKSLVEAFRRIEVAH